MERWADCNPNSSAAQNWACLKVALKNIYGGNLCANIWCLNPLIVVSLGVKRAPYVQQLWVFKNMFVHNQKGGWVYFNHNPELAFSSIVELLKNTQFAFSLQMAFICSCFSIILLLFCFSKTYRHQQAECQKYFSCWTCPNFFFSAPNE